MKFLLVITALVAVALAEQVKVVDDVAIENPAFGYLRKYGIPAAEKQLAAEERYHAQKIVGGSPAGLGLYPWQGALIIDLIGVNGNAICGASLVSENRLITAAHCWSDGRDQAWRFTVILGTVFLFTGGTRIQTTDVVPHSEWAPAIVRNDIAMIYLPEPVSFSSTIAPVALPSGDMLQEDFAGEVAIASGFGWTADDEPITVAQFLSHVRLNVITNRVCAIGFPFMIQPSNICTSGIGGVGTCRGDSGGPLVVERNGEPVLIGVTSFGSAFGCELIFPAAFARVTSFMDFINANL